MQKDEIILSVVIMLVGTVLGLVLTKLTEAVELPSISHTRRRALTGTWRGVYHQRKTTHRPQVDIPIACSINSGYRKVRGTFLVRDVHDFSFSLDGGFYHDRFIRLNYAPSGKMADAIDFGVCFLALGDFPDRLDGLLTGWGSLSKTFISGNIELSKISPEIRQNLSAELSNVVATGTET